MIKDIIIRNRVVKFINKGWFYFALGKAQLGKFTSLSGEISLLILLLTQVFGYDLKQHKMVFFTIIILSFTLLLVTGYVYHKLGFWEVELKVNMFHNPLETVKYEAARIIIDEHKNLKIKDLDQESVEKSQESTLKR